MPSNLRTYSFLLIIPGLSTALSFLFRASAGPFWLNCDPSYLYLFNALHMVKGLTPTYLDNPGTPLQILILWVIYILNIGHSAAETLSKVLLNPEFYLQVVYSILVLSSLLTSVLLASYAYNKTHNKTAALLTQLPLLSFFFPRAFETTLPVIPAITNIGAESFLICIINLFNLCFLRLFFAKTFREELLAVLSLGLVCGLGFATKLTFISLVLISLLIVSWRMKIFFIGGFAAAFVLGTLPVIHKYPILFKSIQDYSTHTSNYGSGPLGFVNWPDFLTHAQAIVSHYWFFVFLTLGILIGSTIQIITNWKDRNNRFLWVVTLGSLIQYIATAKHFAFHYLIPGLGLFSSIFFLFYLKQIAGKPAFQRITMIFISLFIIFCVIQDLLYCKKMSAFGSDIIHLYNKTLSIYPNATVISTSSIASNIYLTQDHGLFFGNYAGLHYENEELSQLYPYHYYFDTERSETRDREDGYGIRDFYGHRIFADDLLASNVPIVFIKIGANFSEHALNVRLIEQSTYASTYLLLASTEKQAYQLFLTSQSLLEKGEFPEAFAFALKSRELNFEPREKIEYFLSIIYSHLEHK